MLFGKRTRHVKRILVVEDEPKVANFIRQGLQEERYSVDVAGDGVEALELLLTMPRYNLIVLDLMLPKRDGFAVLKTLRERGVDTPILVLTARDAVADRVAGLDLGADDYLTKPFAFDEFLARVRALLRRGTVIPAHPLALTADRELDAVRQARLTRYYLDAGMGGVAVGVHTTQFDIRKVGLYEPVLRIAKEAVQQHPTRSDAITIAGVVGDTPQAVKEAETAAALGYDLVLVGQNGQMRIDVDAIEAKLASPEYAQVAQSLAEIGFNSATDLFATFAGNEPMLRPWLADAQINRDRNLRLQFLAGEGLNQYNQAAIYSQMLQYRQWPEGLFVGSPDRLARIRLGERVY